MLKFKFITTIQDRGTAKTKLLIWIIDLLIIKMSEQADFYKSFDS